MINQMSVLAVIPARGGSKGIYLKNLRTINGMPLVVIAGDIASKVDEIDRYIVSTDHKDIAKTAQNSGIEVPFLRPKYISGDQISDLDVLHHALKEMERIDRKIYDIVVMLQPTSPLRTVQNVSDAIKELVIAKKDSVWTVSKTDLKNHPLKQLVIEDNGNLNYFDSRGASIVARQQLLPTFYRNGAAYVFTRKYILEKKNILGSRTGAVIINEPQISIDTEEDIRTAEAYINSINSD
jgi:CMP-N,N'-diacetyllegionaminic acid synthase